MRASRVKFRRAADSNLRTGDSSFITWRGVGYVTSCANLNLYFSLLASSFVFHARRVDLSDLSPFSAFSKAS